MGGKVKTNLGYNLKETTWSKIWRICAMIDSCNLFFGQNFVDEKGLMTCD